MDNFDRVIDICKRMIENGKAKEKPNIKIHAFESIQMIYSMLDSTITPEKNEAYESFVRKEFGERSTQAASYLFLKAKK